MMKTWVLVAAAAMGLTACQNDIDEQIEAKDSVTVQFVADSADSRTSVDTSGEAPVFAWAETGETFAVLEQTTALAKATAVTYANEEGLAKITATFDDNSGQAEYKYVTIYPESGYVSAEGIEAATLTLPAAQTMAEGSYDPAADLMVSKVVTTTAQPTEAQMVRFTRLAAVAKMSFKGLESGDMVESVTFTAEGKTLAGNVTADLADPHAFTAAEGGSNSITVTAPVDGASEVYFTLLPTTLEANDSYTITVVTDKKIYKKTSTIPEGKSLAFAAGMVTRFGVDLSTATASEKWVLVRNVNDLEAGDIVTFASEKSSVVLGAKFYSTNYPYGSQTDIVKSGDYFYHPIATEDTKVENMVQKLVVAKQNDKFYFYNGVDYSDDEKAGFVCVKSSTYFTLQDAINDNSLFDVSIDAKTAVATVQATNSTVTAKYVYYYPNTSLTTRSFRGKSSAPTADQNICIYKIEGAKGVIDASITLPESGLVVAGKDANSGTIEDVVFNYTDNWNISISEEADWLEINYADGELTYTTQVNENIGTRKAVVTIKATCNGAENAWEFTLLQKGEPQPISVADFIGIEYDSKNVESLYYDYSVTGVLKSKASAIGVSTKVVDANDESKVATFKYIYLTDGETTFYDNSGDVKVGDIVTIVAPLTDDETGGSSTYHATYMGYYNLSATAAADHVAYSGGDVKITIGKTGTLTPQTIKGSVSANFATLTYTDNATEATVKLDANDGAPREVVVTFTDGYATASVTIIQGADASKGNTWELVTDATTLEAGDQVIIAAKDYDVALSTTISSDRRSEVAVTKLGNYYLTPADGVQTFVLGAGSEDKTFAFYDDTNKGYLVSTSKSSSSYYLKNQAYVDANTSFAISIAEDGTATIGNTAGTYNENKLYYYQSKQYFYSGTTEQQAISLYRLVGVKGTIPVTPADVTVPEKSVVVVEQGVAEPTAISEVEFNYVGDWTITATSDAEWLTSLSFDKEQNCLTYTAAANEGAVRYATVTIKASLAGQEDITWTFNVLQKGAPEEISIADFITKPVDVNVEYKITGKVKVVPSSNSASATYEIEDANGNVAKATYLYTEGGSLVKTDDAIDLAVGDVVTITGAVADVKGKIGSSSTYKSTYKGHYRLTATAETAIVGYEGGDATISVALTQNGTLGTLCAPTAIEGTMTAEGDFATFSYTTDAPTATVNFGKNAGASRKVEATFKSGLAEVTVAVGQQNDPSVKVGWFLVTDVNELAVGDKVIIAGKNPDETLDYAISSKTSTSGFRPSIGISVTGECIDDVTGVQQYTLESGHADYAGTWAFKGDSDSKYLYVSSGSLKVTSTLDKHGSWTVTVASNGKTTLTSNTTSTSNTMMLNYTTSNQTFSMYKSTQTGKGAIYLYKYYNSLEQ